MRQYFAASCDITVPEIENKRKFAAAARDARHGKPDDARAINTGSRLVPAFPAGEIVATLLLQDSGETSL